MQSIERIAGGCLCGAVRYQASGTAYGITHCHCRTCRRVSGAPFVTWAGFDSDKFNFTQGQPASYASSKNLRRPKPKAGAQEQNYGDAKKFILSSSEITQREQPFSHPWNPKSQLIGVQLGRALGLKRTGISIARMPPGKESFVYHSHQHEEEWLYILSGRGIAEIDGEEIEVGAGDFMAFPTPSTASSFEKSFRSRSRLPDGW